VEQRPPEALLTPGAADVPSVPSESERIRDEIPRRGRTGRPRPQAVAREAAVVAFFILVACLAHWKLVFQGLILVDYDAFVYFYANREYTAARLLAGQLPLWNPYVFAGIPHLANPQSAVFYPGTWIFLLLPTPYAYSANLVLHTAIAGWGMSLLAHHMLGASRIGGLVAGVSYMLSGVITAQGGHLNQLSAAALLPFVVLAAHRTITRLSVGWSLLMAIVLTLQLLAGHPQVTYLTLALVAFMLLWEMAASEPRRWIGQAALVALGGTVAGGLCAVQLLPTLEATQLGIRAAGLSIGEAAASSLPPEMLPLALLPGYTENPTSTEFLGFIGAAGLTLAMLGAASSMSGRHSWLVVAAILSLLISLGGYSPVFEMLFGVMPGLQDFRVPARWLLPWTVCVSLLAGVAIGRTSSLGWPRRLLALTVGSLPVGLAVWAGQHPGIITSYAVPASALRLWPAVLALTLLFWLGGIGRLRVAASTLTVVLIVGELLMARADLPFSHVVPAIAWKYQADALQELSRTRPSYRFLSIAGNGYQPERTGRLRQQYPGIGDYAFELFVTATKWAEVQTPNLPSVYRLQSVDGYDGGVFPLRNYVLASALLHPLGDVRQDGVLISSLDAMPRRSALDLFGVSAVVASLEKDVEVNGVGFERSVYARRAPGESLSPTGLPSWPVRRIALLLGVEGAAPRSGEPVLEVRARDVSGRQTVIPLMAGLGVPLVDEIRSGRSAGEIVQPWRATSGLPETVFVEVRLDLGPLELLEIRNVSSEVTLVIGGATAQGEEPEQERALPIDPDLSVQTMGEIRVYTRSDPLPRAYLSHQAAAMTDEQATEAMFEPDWLPSRLTILESGVAARLAEARGAERVNLRRNDPEEVIVDLDASSAGLLVLSDPWYPGWKAELDGQPIPIRRANLHFRAVEVPGGLHQVKFVYDPKILKMGAAVSAVTTILAAVLAMFGQRLKRVLQ
jgi:hypothetical protein